MAPNVPDPPTRPTCFDNLKGYYLCGKCHACKINIHRGRKITEFTSAGTGVTYPIKTFITCKTKCVVYLLRCPCILEQVGRTIRMLHIRIGEYINICTDFDKHNVSKHYDLKHNRDPRCTTFVASEKYVPHWRGSNGKRDISRAETNWIF